MGFDMEVEALAQRQHGLVTRAQVHALGCTSDAIRHRCRTGRWIRQRRGVFRLAGAVVSPKLELLAVVLATPGSAASHQSAAALVGTPGFAIEPAHVTTECEVRPRRHVIVHRSSMLPEDHLRVVDGIRCTSVARTIFDLCGSLRPGRSERALDNVRARRLTTVPTLRKILDDLAEHGRDGTVLCRELLDARLGRYVAPESELETRFIEFVRAHRLPEPARQVDLGDVDGWIGRVDFLFRDSRVVVEVDGHVAHAAHLDRIRDATRDRRLTEAGWTVRRVTWRELTGNPTRVALELRRALAAGTH